jgi:hypothetical protein
MATRRFNESRPSDSADWSKSKPMLWLWSRVTCFRRSIGIAAHRATPVCPARDVGRDQFHRIALFGGARLFHAFSAYSRGASHRRSAVRVETKCVHEPSEARSPARSFINHSFFPACTKVRKIPPRCRFHNGISCYSSFPVRQDGASCAR